MRFNLSALFLCMAWVACVFTMARPGPGPTVMALGLYIYALGASPLVTFGVGGVVGAQRAIPVTLRMYGMVLVTLIACVVASMAIHGTECWQPAV